VRFKQRTIRAHGADQGCGNTKHLLVFFLALPMRLGTT